MKKCTLCGVGKPLDQFYKRADSPDGRRHDCKECIKLRNVDYYKANTHACNNRNNVRHAAKIAANPNWYAEQYAAKREYMLSHSKKQYRANAAKRIVKQKQWAEANPDKTRAYKDAWKKSNMGAVREASVRRRRVQSKQTPAWADRGRIKAYYDVCAFFNAVNGYPKYHVDHIIPLKGTLVSGLHVHSNLRVIPARENERKNNKFEVL